MSSSLFLPEPRLIVTYHDKAGKSIFISDTTLSRNYHFGPDDVGCTIV